MKKFALLLTVLALAAFASAQQQVIDFDSLPENGTPNTLPENYAGLSWQGMDMVVAQEWDDAGAGFFSGNHVMLVFGGGPLCFPNYGGINNDGTASKNICQASLSVGVGPNALTSFQADSTVMASGWINNSIVVVAYRNGVEVGRRRYNLTTTASNIVFPNSWGPITQLTITPSAEGSFVMYTLNIN